MLDGEQHCDHQTQIIHAQPNCFSRELYKGVLDGRVARRVQRQGVRPPDRAEDGRQADEQDAAALGRRAQIDTKPQLEIFADDVKCTHGATIGQIDQTALFYLKSRGIDNATGAAAADVRVRRGRARDDRGRRYPRELEQATLERFV